MGVKGRVPNPRQTGAFLAGAESKSSANQNSCRAKGAELGKKAHPFPFAGPVIIHLSLTNSVASGRHLPLQRVTEGVSRRCGSQEHPSAALAS